MNHESLYHVGGDFTLEQLNKNNNQIFVYYVETDYYDSYRSEINNDIDFVEVFLTKEKALNLKKAISLIEKAIGIHSDSSYGKNKSAKEKQKEVLDKLTIELKNLGFDKDLTKNTRRNPLANLEYEGENGTKKSIYVSWKSSYSDLKHYDDIIERICIVPELKDELLEKKKKKSI